MDAAETHEKIINVLKEKGPSLPMNLAKALSISSLFISAFLSELTNQNRVEVSSLKVGGSPLYYMKGQEEKLEEYYTYLHPRESEAFLLLKEHRVLRDSHQDPATRVALRAIKDFSVGFKVGDEIYWKFVSVPGNEVDLILNGSRVEVVKEESVSSESKEESKEVAISNEEKPVVEKVEIEENVDGVQEKVDEKISSSPDSLSSPIIEKPIQIQEKPKETVVVREVNNEFHNPLVVREEKKKEKPKSDFVDTVVNFITVKGLEIIEEKDYKTKEYNCVVRVKSELGPISFLTQAKDKKTITEGDFKKLLSHAQAIPLPAFMLYTGEISKKAQDYLKDYGSVLKAKKIRY